MQGENQPSRASTLGWLYLIANLIFFGVGIVAYFFLSGLGSALGNGLLMRVLNVAGQASLFFFVMLALPGLLAGLALLQRQPWATSLSWAVALLHLINFPLGTLLSIYAFRVLPEVGIEEKRAVLKPARTTV